jgi:signal transduction histidine kinase
MSHELRTPLNAILGFAQMLGYEAPLTPAQQDHVQEILKGGDICWSSSMKCWNWPK